MSERPWYKRYGADFVHGTLGLTLEQKGAYSLCLDLIYDRGGPIPDDDRWLAGVCSVSVRKWKTIREALIRHGKLHLTEDGLHNSRAKKEIENALKTRRKLSENGAKGAAKRDENRAASNKNNELAQARPKHRAHKPEARSQSISCSPDGEQLSFADKDEVRLAFDTYNQFAQQHDLPKAAKLSTARRASIKARLKDAGGIEGWTQALNRIAKTPGLLGQNNRGWRVSLDFLCQESSFIKLMEGQYDRWTADNNEGQNRPAGNTGRQSAADHLRAAMAGEIARRSGGDVPEPGDSSTPSAGATQVRTTPAAATPDVPSVNPWETPRNPNSNHGHAAGVPNGAGNAGTVTIEGTCIRDGDGGPADLGDTAGDHVMAQGGASNGQGELRVPAQPATAANAGTETHVEGSRASLQAHAVADGRG